MLNQEELERFLTFFEAIIFDLDGVILDSVQLKVDCMREALSNFDGKVVELYLADFIKEFGQSRLFHFKNFYHCYLNFQDGFDEFYNKYAKLYADILESRYAEVRICEYADSLILLLSKIGLKLFVATGTSTKEAVDVLGIKKLKDYFVGIFGSPNEKDKIIKNILCEHGFSIKKTLMIGDSMHDRDSAFKNQIPFLYVERYSVTNKLNISQGFPFPFPFYSVKSLDPKEYVKMLTGTNL